MTHQQAAAGMFSGIRDFLAEATPTCLQSINVVVFDKSMLGTFEQAHKDIGDGADASLPSEVKLPNLCTIAVEQGSVANSKADVIVATRGVVFDAVLKGDPTVSSEWKKKYPKGWTTQGEICCLDTSKLPAKLVFGIAPLARDKTKVTSSECNKQLADVIAKCIQTADGLKFTSIAFPAIGTGGLGFTNAASASTILEGARTFSNNVKNPALKLIKIVVFDGHRITDFLKELQKFTSPSKFTSATPLSSPTRTLYKSAVPVRIHQMTAADSVSLMVCGRNEPAVRQAVFKLKKAVKDNCISERVDADISASFDQGKLEEIAKESKVTLTVSPCGPGSKSAPVIYVSGERSNVQNARLLITQQLLKMSGGKFILLSAWKKLDYILVGSVEYPPSWTSDPESENAEMVALQQSDSDYKYVSNKFWSTLKDEKLKNVKIKDIQRIENRSFYRRFAQAKEELRRARAKEIDAKKAVLQMDLFHGTHKDSVQHIIDCGFNRSFAGSVVGNSR